MPDVDRTFDVASDAKLVELIKGAKERLVIVCPAIGEPVAGALAKRLEEGFAGLTVILDADPEVYRLGFGTEAGLDLIRAAADRWMLDLRTQPGVRIGVIISDDLTMVFSPVAQLVDAGSTSVEKPNAIVLSGAATAQVAQAAGAGPADSADRQEIGQTPFKPEAAKAVKDDLKANPPQRFDIARIVRVFNAAIEFVELELVGTQIQRQTISLSKTVFAAIDDDETKERINAAYKLIDPAGSLSGRTIARKVDKLRRVALKPIPGFGQTIRRIHREKFENDLEGLRSELSKYQQQVAQELEAEIQKSKEALIKALAPGLLRNPRPEFLYSCAGTPTEADCERFLRDELNKIFPSAAKLTGQMSLRCTFKGVTYETLNDPNFIEHCRKAYPDLEQKLFDEFEAAKAKEVAIRP